MRGNIYQALPAVEVDKLVRRAVRANRRRYFSSIVNHTDFEDLCQTVHVQLLKFHFDPERGTPSTFVQNCTFTALGLLAKKLHAKKSMEPHTTSVPMIEDQAIVALSDWSIAGLPIRSDLRDILLRRFALEQTLDETAAASGLTKKQVRLREAAALDAAKRCLCDC